MKNVLIHLFFSLLMLPFYSSNLDAQDIAFALSEEDKKEILIRIEIIKENDQLFRKYMGVGTFDARVNNRIDELLKEGDLRNYFAFKDSLNFEFSPYTKKAIIRFQSSLDSINLEIFKEIVDTWGYPSKERLGVKGDALFPLLLHPSLYLDIEVYQQEMFDKLLPEVEAKRMKAHMLASFYDNMNFKILKLPQLYGTSEHFDRETQELLPPIIGNIKETNKARIKIGLNPLKEGEYRIESEID